MAGAGTEIMNTNEEVLSPGRTGEGGRGGSTGIAGSPQHFYLPTAVQRTVGGHQNIRIFFIVYCFVYNKQVAPKFCSFPVL